ncbi:MAG TPA: hypothetical protein VEY91_01660 [Candidatus Limnocylindria bacterium]|nr:hypothetical protein [Candidatus Limnocylindria bacterium]
MSARRVTLRLAQAWVELIADDPAAVSALAVARARLSAGRTLATLRRLRLFELRGALPQGQPLADLLHRSTQFYNPHKERCHVRTRAREASMWSDDAWVVLVKDRDGCRRAAAERWWRHETGDAVEVHEAVAWVLSFEPAGTREVAEELVVLRDRRHGLLCNPHAQAWALSGTDVPLAWITAERGDARSIVPGRTS